MRETKAGKIEFRVDKAGNVHAPIGKVSFGIEALETNFTAFMDQIVRSKPAAAKGVYVKNVSVSSTMGPGVTIDTTPYRWLSDEAHRERAARRRAERRRSRAPRRSTTPTSPG